MEPVTQLDLLAWATEGLDPSRRRALGERIAASPELRARLAVLARQVAGWRAHPARPAPLPRPVPSLRAALQTAPRLGSGPLRPGDLFYVYLHDVPDAATRFLVVLRDHGEGWRGIYPTGPEDLHSADRLPLDGDALRLGLSADDQLGVQRWAVALPPLWMSLDWTLPAAERWAPILAGVAQRSLPFVEVEIEVRR